jgi:predicted ribosomally synthesized peptide with SipW-like signal peptide
MRIGANAISSSSRASMSRMATVLLAVMLVGLLTLSGSRAAFSDTTSNTNNSLSTGTVTLIDDDTGLAMFSVTDMAPLDTAINCIEVEYAGSLTGLNPVVLYAGANGGGDTGLGTYLDLTIEVGTLATFNDCSSFAAIGTMVSGGTVADFAAANTDYASGVATGWTPVAAGETRAFRVTVALQDDNAAQGLVGQPTFTWEVQSN